MFTHHCTSFRVTFVFISLPFFLPFLFLSFFLSFLLSSFFGLMQNLHRLSKQVARTQQSGASLHQTENPTDGKRYYAKRVKENGCYARSLSDIFR
ncbi:MAG: hypothetical protein DA446_07795 [Bacteroidetes bacterium]|nr:MAG: hypothetical protein DA446_07795 [Bacteroidota bacterium]